MYVVQHARTPRSACWGSRRVHARMQERVTLRDCQVGPDFRVSEGSEHRDEVLAKAQTRRSSEYNR